MRFGTKGPRRSSPLKCSNLARGESMKDPASVLGCWRGFHFGLHASTHKATQLTNGSNDCFSFSRDQAARSSDRDARPRHHSRPQTGERPSRPPRLCRRRWVCRKLRDHLHQSSKPDTSAWCPPPFPRDNARGNGTGGREPCRNRMEPTRLRSETERKLLRDKAIIEA